MKHEHESVKHEFVKHEFVKHEHESVKHEFVKHEFVKHEHEYELKGLPLNLIGCTHIRFEASKSHWMHPHKV